LSCGLSLGVAIALHAVLVAAAPSQRGRAIGVSSANASAASVSVAGVSVAGATTPSHDATAPSSNDGEPRFAVGVRVLRLVDTSRAIRLPHGKTEPRTLVTYVRYPALGAPEGTDLPDAPPARAAGPFPLVVFAHGYDVTPRPYAHLLQSWARAGYVVAAPVFPLENPGAPGGPDEADLANEPRDMSFVISRLLTESASSADPLAGLVDPAHIAVAGHSDGGETALAVAYSRRFHDPRVDAAMVFSGAEMSGIGGFDFAAHGPPLLAAQGTADTSNEPRFTYSYFDAARRPKYLLRLLGAEHLPPYTTEQPQLGIVERVTGAFLDEYLEHAPGALRRLRSFGGVPGLAALVAEP
jgi:dienelactone hydrolase